MAGRTGYKTVRKIENKAVFRTFECSIVWHACTFHITVILWWPCVVDGMLSRTAVIWIVLVLGWAEEMLDGLSKSGHPWPMSELLTLAFCKKRLEEDLCWIIPHVFSMTHLITGLNRTEFTHWWLQQNLYLLVLLLHAVIVRVSIVEKNGVNNDVLPLSLTEWI